MRAPWATGGFRLPRVTHSWPCAHREEPWRGCPQRSQNCSLFSCLLLLYIHMRIYISHIRVNLRRHVPLWMLSWVPGTRLLPSLHAQL